jgi:hypothetical protein
LLGQDCLQPEISLSAGIHCLWAAKKAVSHRRRPPQVVSEFRVACHHRREDAPAVLDHFDEPLQSGQSLGVQVVGLVHEQRHRLFCLFDQLA